jgi:hypothetical protein
MVRRLADALDEVRFVGDEWATGGLKRSRDQRRP